MKSTQTPVNYILPPKEEDSYSEIIRRMEEELALNCFICSHTFNTTNRAPTIVCRRQHTYCAECVTLIQRVRPNRCPECRFRIYEENIFINRPLHAICQFFPYLKTGVDHATKQNERLIEENNRLARALEEMKMEHQKEIEQLRKSIKLEGMNLKQRQERLFTIAKQKHKETKVVSEIKQDDSLSANEAKLINPEERKGMRYMKMKRRYTKPSPSTSKRKTENTQQVILNPRIHSYRIQ